MSEPTRWPAALSADLHQYLEQSRAALLRALDGVGEYDARRPLTTSGTNLLGLVKHLAGVESGYLGTSVGRPGLVLPWYADGSVWDGADMWVRADESREYVLDLYEQCRRATDAALHTLPLDHPAVVEHWPPERRHSTFGHLVVRMVAETAQHAGHAEILRERLDGQAGRDHDEMGDPAYWSEYVATIQAAAEPFRTEETGGADRSP